VGVSQHSAAAHSCFEVTLRNTVDESIAAWQDRVAELVAPDIEAELFGDEG
jgi:hypothetical protein